MAYSNNIASISARAAADLSAHQFKVVELDANGEAALALAGRGDGIVQNHPDIAQMATVADDGQSKAIAGGAVTRGQYVRASSGGWCVQVNSGDAHVAGGMQLLGKAMITAASGDIFTVDFHRDRIVVVSGAAFSA